MINQNERNSNNANMSHDIEAIAADLHRQLADFVKTPPKSFDELERRFRLLHKIQTLQLKREALAIARLRAEKKSVGRVPQSAVADSPSSVLTPRVPVPPTAQSASPFPSKPAIVLPSDSLSNWIDKLTGTPPAEPKPYTPSWINKTKPNEPLCVFPPATRILAAA